MKPHPTVTARRKGEVSLLAFQVGEGMQAQLLAYPSTVVDECGWAGWDLAAARCAVAGLLA
jgi:hypothetical protein